MGSAQPARRRSPLLRAPGRYFGVVIRPRTYGNILYLLLGLPLGTAWFVYLVTGLATGAGLAITIVGLPLLVFVVQSARLMARFDAAQTNFLTGSHARTVLGRDEGNPLKMNGIAARLKNGRTWSAIAFLFVRFPQGIATFVIAVTALSVVGGLIAVPVVAPFSDVQIDGVSFQSTTSEDGEESIAQIRLTTDADAAWKIDTPAEGLLFAIPGLLLLPAVLHGLNGLGRASGKMTELFLGQGPFSPPPAAAVVTAPAPPTGTPALVLPGEPPHPAAPWPALVLAAEVRLGSSAAAATVAEQAAGAADAPPAGDPPPGDDPAGAAADDAADGPPIRIVVDETMRTVLVGDQYVELTPREFDLVALLARTPGRPFSRQEILDRIWVNDLDVTDRTVDTHIQRLRRKLGPGAASLRTVWGIGYRLDQPR